MTNMINKEKNITQIVMDAAFETSNADKKDIGLSTRLVEDLEMDSLELIEFAIELEIQLHKNKVSTDIEFGLEDLQGKQLSEIVDFISDRI